LKVHVLKALSTNYFYILEIRGKAILFDPGEAQTPMRFLLENGLTPKAIWLTHHHHDHVDGVPQLAEHFQIPVYASRFDAARLPFVTDPLKWGEEVRFDGNKFEVIDLKGHAHGQIGYYCKEQSVLFSGDALFSFGCGRLLEGTAEEHFESLERIKSLPENTKVYFSHEYSLKNLEFAESISDQISMESDFKDLQRELNQRLTSEGLSTPTTVGFEKKNNPFLRVSLEKFKEIRRLRDRW